MAVKQVELAGIGTVKLYRRRGMRGIRLTLTNNQIVRVTLPKWMPYSAGIEFVRSKEKWILDHRSPKRELAQDQNIGKKHYLNFIESAELAKPTGRIVGSQVRIMYPTQLDISSPLVQAAAQKAATKALKKEADEYLGQRLSDISELFGFSYHSFKVKQLKSRWGSCSSKKDITLNIFLVLLPNDLVDYVIVHELVHTKVLHHGKDFWAEFTRCMPNARQLQKQLRQYNPSLST